MLIKQTFRLLPIDIHFNGKKASHLQGQNDRMTDRQSDSYNPACWGLIL